jgi:hypothetical protein
MGLTKMATKVLVAGDTDGRFAKLMKAVGSAHAKAGPFDACFCVGAFFGSAEARRELIPYLTGQAKVPVPTYFILGAEPEGELPVALPEEGCELCPNLTYLGRQGCRPIESCGGLTVAYLSGVHSAAEYSKPRPAAAQGDEMALDRYYRETDVQWLRTKCDASSEVDFVLTSEWGAGVDSLLATSPLQPPPAAAAAAGAAAAEGAAAAADAADAAAPRPSPVVGELMEVACPRYHFAGSQGVYHVLAPYRSKQPEPGAAATAAAGITTRFDGLGKCGNVATPTVPKQKALQALGIKLRRSLQTAEERAAASELYAKATPHPYLYHKQHGGGGGGSGSVAGATPRVVYFLPSHVFMGARRGYEFKLGRQGQGYYRTDGAGSSDDTNQTSPSSAPSDKEDGGGGGGARVLGAQGPPPPRRLYVSGISWSATELELRCVSAWAGLGWQKPLYIDMLYIYMRRCTFLFLSVCATSSIVTKTRWGQPLYVRANSRGLSVGCNLISSTGRLLSATVRLPASPA